MMKISARNQFKGTVLTVKEGAVSALVAIDLGGEVIKADITMDAVRELDLIDGKPAIAVIKASSVMFATGLDDLIISSRNQFHGTVTKVVKGSVNGQVAIRCSNGMVVSGSITNEAIDDLGLEMGSEATAIIKSTDVLVAVEL